MNARTLPAVAWHVTWFASLLPAVLLPLLAPAQSADTPPAGTGSIRGVVLDRVSREPVAAANVVLYGENRGAAADMVDGAFHIENLAPGIYTLTASALGYQPQTVSEIVVSPGRARDVEFLLQPSTLRAEEMTFTVNLFELPSTDLPTSSRTLRYEEVRRAPGGLEDVQRTLQALPGIVNANDQSNQIIVRGGEPNENLTVIDGLEVDNTNHFSTAGEGNGGAINALNTEFLRDVTFASGGFSARYGDRLSSVLALGLRDGNRDRFNGSANFDMAGAGGLVEGPIGGNGSYLASVHRSFLELLPGDAVGLATVPWYWNTQTHVTYDLSNRHRITINGLYLHDEQLITPEDTRKEIEENGESYNTQFDGLNYNSSGCVAGARLRSMWGPGFTELVLGRSWNRRETEVLDATETAPGLFSERRVFSERETFINDQIHLTWNGRAFHEDDWSAGISVRPQTWRRDEFAVGDSIFFDDGYLAPADGAPDSFHYADRISSADELIWKTGAFVQYSWRPMRKVALTAGFRYDGLDLSGQQSVLPRLSATWQFRPRWTLSLAWGLYSQTPDPGILLDPDAHGANQDLPFAKSTQVVAGLRYLPRESSQLSVEGYYKDYDDLLVREEDIVREQTGDRRYESDRWLPRKTKQAWGIELFDQQKLIENWYGTLSYSYSESETRDPAFGACPSDYDYRHVATAVLGYKTSLIQHPWYRNVLHTPWLFWLWLIPVHGDQLTLSTRYRTMSGRPYSQQVWYEQGEPSPDPVYEGHWETTGHNNARFTDYERWDFRLDNKYDYSGSALVFYLELQNLLDRGNIADYFYQDDGSRNTIEQFRQFWVAGVRYEF